ncbi:MAG: hypothetical protein RR565_01525 [Erysipelothrix sp.]
MKKADKKRVEKKSVVRKQKAENIQPVEEKKHQFVRFSVKSSLIILFGILLSSLLIPLLLDGLGLQLLPLRVILIGLTTAFVVSYCLYFVDSKRGATRGFWIVFGLVAALSMIISYYWVYEIYFI